MEFRIEVGFSERRNWALDVDKDASGGPQGEPKKCEVWMLSSAGRYVEEMDCDSEVSIRTICTEVLDSYDKWTVSDH